MKSGNLNFLESSGPPQACSGTAFTACKIHIWGYQSLWDLSLLTAVLMKIHIFKDVIPRQLVYTWRCSGGVCYLHLQGWWLFTNQHGITFQKTCIIFYVVFSFKHLYTHVLYKTITIHIIAPHIFVTTLKKFIFYDLTHKSGCLNSSCYRKILLLVSRVMKIWRKNKFYIHGSMHRESNLITVQQDATYSVYYISAGSSTCFGCRQFQLNNESGW